MQTVAPCAEVAVPLVLSSFSDKHHGEKCTLAWEVWHDGLNGRVTDGMGEIALPAFDYGTTDLGELKVNMPGENAAAVLSLYLKDGRVKLELAVAKGKKLYDKRHSIAARDAERDMERRRKGDY